MGLLVGWGLFSPDDVYLITTDPELIEMVSIGIGSAMAVGTECFYVIARKLGWER